jgi:hypothetical protein
LAILLNTLGIISGGFWGFFWSILFMAIGVKLLINKSDCPCCAWHFWKYKKDNCDCNHHHNTEK